LSAFSERALVAESAWDEALPTLLAKEQYLPASQWEEASQSEGALPWEEAFQWVWATGRESAAGVTSPTLPLKERPSGSVWEEAWTVAPESAPGSE
jgi:hypothetical protein